MIIYFADRKMEILGHATTELMQGLILTEDVKTEEIDTGVAAFSCKIPYTEKTRQEAELCTEVGNYILRKNGEEKEFYTIIDTEKDTKTQEISVYAEDAGLDLLNEILPKYAADKAYTLTSYVERFVKDSGFEVGLNEAGNTTKKLAWDSEATATERLMDVVSQFDCEISFSFDIERLSVTHKYINIHKKRGREAGVKLRLNMDIDRIITKKSIANLATALLCVGGTPEDTGIPVTLEGYKYDDGDFYVTGKYLKSRNAVDKWSRYVWVDEPNKLAGYQGHIVKTFSYNTVSQAELCRQAVTELKKICDLEINYEVDIARLPDNVKIGDRVDIVDDEGALYLSARILKLEISVSDHERKATLGEYIIKDSGISQRVEELAKQFSELAQARTFYTWVAYADDEHGAGISLEPAGKAYMGTAVNRLDETVEISDPAVFTWVKVRGPAGTGGVGVKNTEVTYQVSASGTTVPEGTWDLDIPVTSAGQYLWTRTVITYTDDTASTSYSVSKNGNTGEVGKGVESIVEQYYLSSSNTALAGGSWSNISPTWVNGKYIWTRSYITWSDHTVTTTTPVLANALNSANMAATEAKSAADGKNTIFYADKAPSSNGRKINDIWFDTANGNTLYYWNGTSWTKKVFKSQAIDVSDIFAQNIVATGTIAGVTLVGATGEFKGTVTANEFNVNTGINFYYGEIESGKPPVELVRLTQAGYNMGTSYLMLIIGVEEQINIREGVRLQPGIAIDGGALVYGDVRLASDASGNKPRGDVYVEKYSIHLGEELSGLLKKFNNQIVKLTNPAGLTSSYFEINSSELRYNKITGHVHMRLTGKTISAIVAGTVFNLGYIPAKYCPSHVVPCAAAFALTSTGNIKCILNTASSDPARAIRARALNALPSGYLIYVSADYYIEAGLA